MTNKEALHTILEFKKLLCILDEGQGTSDTRSEVNQSLPSIQRIIGMAGTGKTLTIAPPPLVGGMIMQNVNPFDMLFNAPYGMFHDLLDCCIDIIDATIGVLKSDDQYIEKFEKTVQERKKTKSGKESTFSNSVFVVHGRDTEKKEACARTLERMGLEAVILHEQANKGKTLIEKFEEYSDVGFAVVLMTPDDMGGLRGEEPQNRARQNVVFELGYFIGKLGRNRVMALVDGNIEIPTDISGVVYTEFDPQGFWKIVLAKELKNSGYNIDMNKLV